MLNIGDKLLDKVTEIEYSITGTRETQSNKFILLKRILSDENTIHMYLEDNLEKRFYFLLAQHPEELDKARCKTKKNRTKITESCFYE